MLSREDPGALAAAAQRVRGLLAESHTITVTEFRRHPGRCIDVIADRPAIIARRGEPVAMLISIEMWQQIEEVEALLQGIVQPHEHSAADDADNEGATDPEQASPGSSGTEGREADDSYRRSEAGSPTLSAAQIEYLRSRDPGALPVIHLADDRESLLPTSGAEDDLYASIQAEFGLLDPSEVEAADRTGLLAIQRAGETLYPAFQVGDGRPLAVIASLRALAAEHDRSDTGVVQWLMAPTTYFDGRRPVDLLRDDPERVLDVARRAWGVEW